MLASKNFVAIWKGKGLPTYQASLLSFSGSGLYDETELKMREPFVCAVTLEIVNPSRMSGDVELLVEGKRIRNPLIFSCDGSQTVKVLDRIQWRGQTYQIFLVEYSDLLDFFNCQGFLVEHEVTINESSQ